VNIGHVTSYPTVCSHFPKSLQAVVGSSLKWALQSLLNLYVPTSPIILLSYSVT